jgi:predicted nuclease with TOPRIM domain
MSVNVNEEFAKLLEENKVLLKEKGQLQKELRELKDEFHNLRNNLLKSVMEDMQKKLTDRMSFQDPEQGKQVVVRLTNL